MDNHRINLIFLWLSLICCLVLLYDASFVPLKTSTEKVMQLKGVGPQDLNPNFTNYTLKTDYKTYDISQQMYHQLEPGNEVIVYRSALTNTRQKLSYLADEQVYTQILSFSRREIGLVFIGFMLLLTTGILIFYKKIKIVSARTNVTIFIVVVLIFFLIMHFS